MSKQDLLTRKLTPQKFLKTLEIHLAEHCNLHCFSCSHFSQLAEKSFYDLNRFQQDLERLKFLTKGKIERFHLLGGEPLLNKNILKYFEILRKTFENSQIWLITNGILLPKQKENFYQSCAEFGIEIHPTKYPIYIQWQSVRNLCEKYGVILKFYNNENVIKNSIKFVLSLEKKNDVFKSFTHCFMSNFCVQMKDGKLFTCNICANIEHFNAKFNTNLEQTSDDFIDIYEAKNYKQILEFLAKPIPFCAYCDVENWKSVGEWRRSKRKIDEYLV